MKGLEAGVGRVLVDRDGRSAIFYCIQLVHVCDSVAVVEMVR